MRMLTFCTMLLVGCGGATATDNGSTSIADIQGAGDVSPLQGKEVDVVGVVSGDFQNNERSDSGDLGGFYAQQEGPSNDQRTSIGVFVYDGLTPATDVRVGDRVRVVGVVKEFFGETQIAATSVSIVGSGSVQAKKLTLPVAVTKNEDGDMIPDLEHLEGMLVHIEQAMTVSNLRFLERFGEVGITQGARPMQFTNGAKPSADGYAAHARDIGSRSIVLDDGDRSANRQSIRFLTAAEGEALRVGDTVESVTANLRYSRGSGGDGEQAWRLVPTVDPKFTNTNPRPAAPAIEGSVRVASFNLLNFFTTLDVAGVRCGPERADSCRGADNEDEYRRQVSKTVTALALLDADIVGVMELENNETQSLAALVEALNKRMGSNDYDFVRTGSIHDGPIKTGFIYRSRTVRTHGMSAILDSSIDARFSDGRNRPALAQSFATIDNGAVVTLVVNHFKSKGSSCASDDDPNNNDGQGNCNVTRRDAAVALSDWIATDPTDSGDPDYLLLGDFNAYAMEDPITAFRDAGLHSLLDSVANPYSMVFDAQSGALDHVVASASLSEQVVAIKEWHINADEAPLYDYNLEHGRDPELFNPTSPYRASDHDPIVIGLDLHD